MQTFSTCLILLKVATLAYDQDVVCHGQFVNVAPAIACQCFLEVMAPHPATGQGHKFLAAKSLVLSFILFGK